jgi:hypothetical protein
MTYAPPPPPPPGYPAPPPGSPAPAPPPYAQPYPYGGAVAQPQGNGLAVAALVLGIISIVFSWVPFFDWLLAILAIIFGAVGISAANKRGGVGKGMAVAGLILGLITVVIGIIFVIYVFSVFHSVCTLNGVNCS